MIREILGPEGQPISSESLERKRRQQYIEGSVVEKVVDAARARKVAPIQVRLSPESLRGAIRRGNRRAQRAGLKGTGRSLRSVAEELAQQSREEAKRITAKQKAARKKRLEERHGRENATADAGS